MKTKFRLTRKQIEALLYSATRTINGDVDAKTADALAGACVVLENARQACDTETPDAC